MVKMKNIIVKDKDTISMNCIDDHKKEFFITFNPSNRNIVECDREMDAYVYHAMYRVATEYKEGTLKDTSVAVWY